MGFALCCLAQRDMLSPYRHDTQEHLRIIAPVFTFLDVTDAAFNQIRQYGSSSVEVTTRLLETIAVVAGFVHQPENRVGLLRHAKMIARGASKGLSEEEDRRAVEERFQAVIRVINA